MTTAARAGRPLAKAMTVVNAAALVALANGTRA